MIKWLALALLVLGAMNFAFKVIAFWIDIGLLVLGVIMIAVIAWKYRKKTKPG